MFKINQQPKQERRSNCWECMLQQNYAIASHSSCNCKFAGSLFYEFASWSGYHFIGVVYLPFFDQCAFHVEDRLCELIAKAKMLSKFLKLKLEVVDDATGTEEIANSLGWETLPSPSELKWSKGFMSLTLPFFSALHLPFNSCDFIETSLPSLFVIETILQAETLYEKQQERYSYLQYFLVNIFAMSFAENHCRSVHNVINCIPWLLVAEICTCFQKVFHIENQLLQSTFTNVRIFPKSTCYFFEYFTTKQFITFSKSQSSFLNDWTENWSYWSLIDYWTDQWFQLHQRLKKGLKLFGRNDLRFISQSGLKKRNRKDSNIVEAHLRIVCLIPF